MSSLCSLKWHRDLFVSHFKKGVINDFLFRVECAIYASFACDTKIVCKQIMIQENNS